MKRLWLLLTLVAMLLALSTFAMADTYYNPGDVVEAEFIVQANPNHAVVAKICLTYDMNTFELIPNQTFKTENGVALLTDITVGDRVHAYFRVLDNSVTGDYEVAVTVLEASDYNENHVYDLVFSTYPCRVRDNDVVSNNAPTQEQNLSNDLPINEHTQISQTATLDSSMGIVPCFGISGDQLLERVNYLFDNRTFWLNTRNVPYENMRDFPLIPSIDYISINIVNYFERDKNAHGYYMYNIDSGELTQLNRSGWYDNYTLHDGNIVLYEFQNIKGTDAIKETFIQIITADGHCVRFHPSTYSHNWDGIVLGISLFDDNNLEDENYLLIAYDYEFDNYPEGPLNRVLGQSDAWWPD